MARTFEEIKGRCIVIDGDDCKEHWVWDGACNRDGQPIVRAPDYGRDPTGQQTFNMGVQRAIHMVTKKKPVRSDFKFFRTCNVPKCVNPDCTSLLTSKRAGVHISRRFKTDPAIQAKLSAGAIRGWDKKGRKIPDEIVLKIFLEADLNDKDAAKKYNVDATTVAHYRSGRLRRKVTQRATGMFSGLLR